ncbi:hypothetical protein K503DRAFT_21203 [Rhizopogon vinicolor AM-OR11-026]|uniref:DUF6533 domain-containing protein n=1 Tax=Rhizopogon vinicolor AM-OR11-026 TaxID=1314800 RepID=A0A1B7MHK0_9AGAM|nr:hypothetical protein K503DRAFT_21203 [Rhizopogon vinicolor AM-OR11-026]
MIISNDPAWWPLIYIQRILSYPIVASIAMVAYDWGEPEGGTLQKELLMITYSPALTLGQEVEFVWTQRWSLMTVLYLSVRYIGIPYSVIVLMDVPSVSITDAVLVILAGLWTPFFINAMLNIIMIARLHAMYQRSRRMLIFLVIIFMAITVAWGVDIVIATRKLSIEVLVLSGIHECVYSAEGDAQTHSKEAWVFGIAWELLALCLALWIVVKHIRELQQSSTRWTAGDCFKVLIKTHVLYFIAFAVVSCFNIGQLSPKITISDSVGVQIYDGVLQIVSVVQMFMLGPRLILSIRQYHAELVADSQAGTGITTIAFQERTHVTTSSGV